MATKEKTQKAAAAKKPSEKKPVVAKKPKVEEAEEQKKRRTIRGFVTSDKMNKSRVMTVERRVRHPLVGKYLKRTSKYMFHDEKNETRTGDEVLITSTRPLSARKSYILHSVLKKAEESA